MSIANRSALLLLILLFYTSAYAQNKYTDSLKKSLQHQKEDSNKVNILSEIGTLYLDRSSDTSVVYGQQALDLAKKINYEPGVLNAEFVLSSALTVLGNYPLAIDFGFKALSHAKKTGDPLKIIWANARLAQCYFYLGDYKTSLQYDRNILAVVDRSFPDSAGFVYTDFSRLFESMGQSDSALWYARMSYQKIKKWNYLHWYTVIYPVLGNAYTGVKDYDSALLYFHAGIDVCMENDNATDLIDIYNGMAKAFSATGKMDSAAFYAKKAFTQKTAILYPNGRLKAASLLTEVYQSKNEPESTLKYLRIATAIKDSLFNRENTIAIQNLVFKEREKQKELDAAKLKLQTRYRLYFLGTGFITLLVIAIILFRNRRIRQIQNMRNSIADDLHDDIGSVLSSISIMNELAKAKAPEALPFLNSIGESTASIQENMSDIVWAVNPKNDAFINLLQRMNQFASEILDGRNIEFELVSDAALDSNRLSMSMRKNLYLFFKEAINNAAKYAEARKVTVRINKKDNRMEMIIEDDGKGFETSQVFNTNGMNTLKKRATELNGDFDLRSKPGQGTRVRCSFKMGRVKTWITKNVVS